MLSHAAVLVIEHDVSARQLAVAPTQAPPLYPPVAATGPFRFIQSTRQHCLRPPGPRQDSRCERAKGHGA